MVIANSDGYHNNDDDDGDDDNNGGNRVLTVRFSETNNLLVKPIV